MDDTYIKIGLITRPHGLKGEVTVSFDPHLEFDPTELKSLFIKQSGQPVPFMIEMISVKGNKAYIKLDGINTLDMANEIAKSVIYIPKAWRPDLDEDEFYADEVVGYQVEDTKEGTLGPVEEIVQSGLQRLLQINSQGKEVLIPIDAPFIKHVDKEKRSIEVELPDGFLDI